MTNEFQPAIEALQAKLTAQQKAVDDTKRLINQLSELAGFDAPFADAEFSASDSGAMNVRPDLFYGQPLASCVTTFLKMRQRSGKGAATVNEIHQALVSGGYKFDTRDEANAKRSLRISLTKNPKFHKLPNATFGLTAWYPKVRTKGTEPETSESDDESGDLDGQSAGGES